MQITVHGQPQEILLSTVVLSKSKDSPDNVYLFHCYNCATRLHKIQGDVSSIHAGLVPTDNVVVLTQCRECRQNYTFQTILGKAKTIKLTLAYEKGHEAFHCVICRSPLVRYNADTAAILPQTLVTEFPKEFTCINQTCNRSYSLDEIVYL